MKSAEEWYPMMAECAGLTGRYTDLKAVVDYDDGIKFIKSVQRDALEVAISILEKKEFNTSLRAYAQAIRNIRPETQSH